MNRKKFFKSVIIPLALLVILVFAIVALVFLYCKATSSEKPELPESGITVTVESPRGGTKYVQEGKTLTELWLTGNILGTNRNYLRMGVRGVNVKVYTSMLPKGSTPLDILEILAGEFRKYNIEAVVLPKRNVLQITTWERRIDFDRTDPGLKWWITIGEIRK